MDNLGINDDWFAEPRSFFDNTRITLGPVSAISCVEPDTTVADMDLQSVAVMLQLVHPAGAGWRLPHNYGAAGWDKRCWSTHGTTQCYTPGYRRVCISWKNDGMELLN